MSEEHKVSLKGIIVPAEMNGDFNITSIMISTDNEEDYVIASDAKGGELFKHLREAVRVTGIVREEKEGMNIIDVQDYEILDHL
ncbi:MAG: hypothetical protein JSU92_12675 [Deltaproteobacteria bacterium]|nr:MAG: hypothetical protein JSU92_12675 [Deltaproteobacteria bacterium]